jgi:hypothetical protein
MGLRDEARRLVQRLAGHRPSAEDERLVALFRNRSELKKELGALDTARPARRRGSPSSACSRM